MHYLRDKQIIFISNQTYYDRYWTSKQYISEELRRRNEVLYVEGNYSFGKMWQALLWKKWTLTLFGRLRREKDKLIIFTPPPRIPGRNHLRLLSLLHQFIQRQALRHRQRQLGWSEPIVWTFLHHSDRLVGAFGEAVFIYHCVDDWPRLMPLAKMGRARQIRRDEALLAQRSDICFCTAQSLRDKLQQFNPRSLYIANAVDVNLFRRARLKQAKPADIAACAGPIIGFIGSLEKWVDSEMLLALFQHHPHWTFVAVGPISKDSTTAKLRALPNVIMTGLKPKEELPAYLAHFDVALIPFRLDTLGKSISPLKLFEYFAAGKAVVAADLPEISRFAKWLWTARDEASYASAIAAAMEQRDNKEFAEQMQQLAEENSWPQRLAQYDAELSSFMKAREHGQEKTPGDCPGD
jgi:glycosyltransferase involved in cell wall biosynthesis